MYTPRKHSPEDFADGQRVRYIPGVAKGDPKHPACEDGRVSSHNSRFVFVKFDRQLERLGWEGTTSQSCDPADLAWMAEIK